MAETTAKRLADYILCESGRRNIDVTNLKLQKLLYYCQGWYLAITDARLFPERIEAWVHGPAVPPVFGAFKEHRWRKIPVPLVGTEIENGDPEYPVAEHVSRILDAYGDLSGPELEALTHRETPWLEARKGLAPDAPSNAVISVDTMRDYFRSGLIEAE